MGLRTLLLIGGGHAHIQVLKDLQIPDDVKAVLVSDSERAVYSGMLPAVVAGLRPLADAEVDLRALCMHQKWQFVLGRCVGLSAGERLVEVEIEANAPPIRFSYHVLSLDVGSTVATIPGARTEMNEVNSLPMELATRPIAVLPEGVAAFERMTRASPSSRPRTVLVIGDGAAGVELAAALRARLQVRVVLIGKQRALERHFGRAVARTASDALAARGVEILNIGSVLRLEKGTAECSSGARVQYDLAVLATGAIAHEWLKSKTDLSCSLDGFIQVSPTLQSVQYRTVFAAGDCVSFGEVYKDRFPRRGSVPRAGVYAVRMGPVLTHNIGAALNAQAGQAGKKMRNFTPQRQFLTLLSLGDGTALGGKYGIAFGPATWCYNFKSHLDQRWQSMFQMDVDESKVSEVEVFQGVPAEGAAALMADARTKDDFGVQYAVLRRMDTDKEFRNRLVEVVAGGLKSKD